MEMMAFLRSEGKLSSLQDTEVCDMSARKIRDLKSVDVPDTVKALELRDNRLAKLDRESLKQCKNLQFLGLSNNKLQSLSGVGSVSGLTLIDVSRNKLASLRGLEKNKLLKEIFAAGNQIENVGIEREMPSVTLLDLQSNPIAELDFGRVFPELFELYMDDCKLTSLDGLATFQKLQHFTAKNNQLTGAQAVRSDSLTNIDVANNHIESLTPFAGMTALLYLNIQGNPVSDEGLRVAGLRSDCLRDLRLARTQISKITPIAEMFPNIEVVDVSQTQLDDINDVLEFVAIAKQLRVLDTRFTPMTNGLYAAAEDDRVWSCDVEYDQHFGQEREARSEYRRKILSQCASSSIEVLDGIGVVAGKKDHATKRDRKQYVHEMIAKYERENEELRRVLKGNGKKASDRLVRLLDQQNNLMRMEMGEVREVMAPGSMREDTYPYVTQLIESLLEENLELRSNQGLTHQKSLRVHSTYENTETHLRQSVSTIRHRTHKHHHRKHAHHKKHHHKQQTMKIEDERPKKEPQEPSQRTGSGSVTYYVQGADPPATPQYPHDEAELHREVDTDKYPYPLKKLRWLKFHPLPEGEEPCACFEPEEKKETQSIKWFEPGRCDGFEEYQYRREMGPWHEVPEKPLPIMYPFNTTAIRKLPWDYADYEPIRPRANKPRKMPRVMTHGLCEELILRLASKEAESESVEEKETGLVLFWMGSAIGFHRQVKQVSRMGLTARFTGLESEYGSENLVLVLMPCSDPSIYVGSELPAPVVVHRFTNRLPTPVPHAYLLCAVALGRQAIDRHDSLVPTDAVVKKLEEAGFNSLWFTRDGVDSLLILDSAKLAPLYGVVMK